MSVEYNVSWDAIQSACKHIAFELVENTKLSKDIFICGIPNGGIIPAATVVYFLRKRLIKTKKRIYQVEQLQDINFYRSFRSTTLKPSIIIVDDLIDSGVTFKRVKNTYTFQKYAVMGIKSKAVSIAKNNKTILFPKEVVWPNTRIVFPWEI